MESYPGETTPRNFMETLLALQNELEQKKKNPTVVLLFDEMDVLLPDTRTSMEGRKGYRAFLSLLWGISQEHGGFLVVGITAANPDINQIGQWKEGTNPMFQFCREIPSHPSRRGRMRGYDPDHRQTSAYSIRFRKSPEDFLGNRRTSFYNPSVV